MIALRQSDPTAVSPLFQHTRKKVQGWISHVEISLKWYVDHHGHHYLPRRMGKHVGNVNTNCAQNYTLKAKLEDIMIERISQEVSQGKPR